MSSLVLLKLEDFYNLQPGWCYGEGTAFSKKMINISKQIATSLLAQGFDKIDAFPGLNGEIRVTAYVENNYLEFTLEKDSVTFLHEANDQELEYNENLSLNGCLEKIRKLNELLPCSNSYELSIKGTLTGISVDFRVLHSNHLQMVVYPYSAQDAPWKQLGAPVNTSSAFTQKSVENRLFFGRSTPPSYRMSI